MSEQLQHVVSLLCRALSLDALPVAEVTLAEQWLSLPGFSPARLKALIEERQRAGRKISSARYFDAVVRETFRLVAVVQSRPRLLTERPWSEYLAAYVTVYGRPDAPMTQYLRDRWCWERRLLGLPALETSDENGDSDSPWSGADPGANPPLLAD